MRTSAFLFSVTSLLLVAQAWDFEIFDGDCITSTDLVSGTTDMEYVAQYFFISRPDPSLSLPVISVALQY